LSLLIDKKQKEGGAKLEPPAKFFYDYFG